MIKARMYPLTSDFGRDENGIRRVVEAYERLLPEYGIQIVGKEDSYDLIISHAGSLSDPDVLITHGLYWTADYPASRWEFGVNRNLILAARHAKQITVPSAWVQEVFSRDMRIKPTIIPHGIDSKLWINHGAVEGYVLWNKNRNDVDVCNTRNAEELARRVPNVPFLSTFANPGAPSNFRAIGLLPHEDMMRVVKHAGVYLSTTKETFGIGILEAMAAGVPVLGWRFGGNVDLVQHGVNGYLAEYGDWEGLVHGLEYCLRNRDVLGKNGMSIARKYTWESSVEKLARVIEAALKPEPATVSVIIPCYNYADKVERAIVSAKEQTLLPDEIIVVDDGSDNDQSLKTFEICKRHGVTYRSKMNGGVATARNLGASVSMSKYLCMLDADDAIMPTFLETCVDALERDRTISIAYTGLQYILPNGETDLSPWPGEYDYDAFLRKQNQVPTCCVFRRDMWARLGGYNQKYAPKGAGAEDAEFFLRAGAYGFGAKKVSNEGLFVYSWKSGRVSGDPEYQEVDWLALHPWVTDHQHPFASLATPKNISHPVRQYDEPLISVIIPVGSNHVNRVRDALDSLESQTLRKWEVIVVWDFEEYDLPSMYFNTSTKELDEIRVAYPFIRELSTGGKGAGSARNAGASIARAPFLLFLDADDTLYPEALQTLYDVWIKEGGIVYSDYVGKAFISNEMARDLSNKRRLLSYDESSSLAVIEHHALEYDCNRAQAQPNPEDMYIWNLITSLVPKQWHNDIGGFDEEMSSWEDWDYWIRLARAGYCFTHVGKSLVVYRFYTGNRRETGLQNYPELVRYLRNKYESENIMPCKSCGGGQKSGPQVERTIGVIEMTNNAIQDEELVLIVYAHPNKGQHMVVGAATRTVYGYRGGGDRFYVRKQDIEAMPNFFLPIRDVREVSQTTAVPKDPVPIEKAVYTDDSDVPVAEAAVKTLDLQLIPGITAEIKEALMDRGYNSMDALKALKVEDLTIIKGIGRVRAETIIEYAKSH